MTARVMVLLAACMAVAGAPAVHAEIDEATARTIYVESGARDQLEEVGAQFPRTIRESMESAPRALPFTPDDLEAAARRAYDVAYTEKAVIEELQSSLDPRSAKKVLAWLRSPLGRRLTQLEIAAGSVEAQEAMERYAQTITEQRPPEKRIELVRSLDEALLVTESATQMMMNMSIAVGMGMLERAPYIDEATIADMRAKIEAERPRMEAEIAPAMFVMLLWSYRDVSDRDLRRYRAFARSEHGRRYQRALAAGVDRALTKAGLRLGEELSQLVPRRQAEKKTTS